MSHKESRVEVSGISPLSRTTQEGYMSAKDAAKQWKVRSIRNKADNVVKRYTRESAAKLVFSGAYEYMDDGPDDSDMYKANWNKSKSMSQIEKQPSEEINMMDLKITDGVQFRKHPGKHKQQRKIDREKKKIDMAKMGDSQRKVLRAQNFAASSPEKKGRVNPPEAVVTKGVNTLRGLIDKKRAERVGK